MRPDACPIPAPSDATNSAVPGIGRTAALILVAIIVGFAALRFATGLGDLWMDEIWSIKAVQELKSAVEIFTRYLQANNHPLSSAWLYAVAPAKADWHYRLLSWFLGGMSVGLGALIAGDQFRRLHANASTSQIRVATFTAAVLFGACYFLVLYSSEARGYAPALAFCLLAFYALVRASPDRIDGWIAVYWLACALALLSHAASVQIILAGLLWSLLSALRSASRAKSWLPRLLVWHVVPLLSVAAFGALFLRRMSVGGSPEYTLRQAMGELVGYTFGFPSPQAGWIALPFLIVATLFALWHLARRAPADAAFYGVVILSAPVTGFLAGRFGVLFPRYFIFGVAWWLLLAAFMVATQWKKSALARGLCVAGVVLFLAGNSLHIAGLLRHGRGEYQAALRYIAEHTTTPDITICSDHDNRNFMLIDYYAARSAPGRRVLYVPGDRTAEFRPQWLIVHRLDGLAAPEGTLFDDRGNEFKLEKKFPHAPLSGWDWFVFRNTREKS